MCKIMNVFGQNGRENLWMFFQAVIAVYLLILSVIDIRWKKVSVRSLLIVWRSLSFFKLVHTRVIWLRR